MQQPEKEPEFEVGEHFDDDAGMFDDWPVFLARLAGLICLAATLITAMYLLSEPSLEWHDVMRVSILPFAAGALLLVSAEVLDRLGD